LEVIVLDSSALLAIVMDEPRADTMQAALEAAQAYLISAGTLSEALIVSRRRNAHVAGLMGALLERLAPEVIPVDAAFARLVADAYDRFGRGVHPAGLNLGDCFAYALARNRGAPHLYVGDDFAKTDIAAAA
jgi:ribonuclease VapC